MKKSKKEKKMENLLGHLNSAFEKNRENFIKEMNSIIKENEYPLTDNCRIFVKGCFHEENCYPFFQFIMEIVNCKLATEFYRSDFGLNGKEVKIDEFEIDYDTVDVITLKESDLI